MHSTRPSKTIYVTFQQEGIHLYPEAKTAAELKDVSFLGHPHRHIFHVKVWLEVTHTNRDVEFILFKRELQKQFSDGQFNSKSCEMICDDIANYIEEKYPGRWSAVDVSEDGENGAYCEYVVAQDNSPYAQYPSHFNQELYDQWLAELARPYGDDCKIEVSFQESKDVTDQSVEEFFGAR